MKRIKIGGIEHVGTKDADPTSQHAVWALR